MGQMFKEFIESVLIAFVFYKFYKIQRNLKSLYELIHENFIKFS